MGKVLALFGFLAVFSLAVYWKNLSSTKTADGDTPATLVTTPPSPETLGVSTATPEATAVWEIFKDDELGLKVRFPKYLTAKKEKDGSLTLSGEGIKIVFVKEKMGTIDTINTLAEKDIDRKIESSGAGFRLIESISPVAIGSQTGVTFTAEESSKEVTYFYVPIDSGYLLITDTTDPDRLSVSDNVIYSLELL